MFGDDLLHEVDESPVHLQKLPDPLVRIRFHCLITNPFNPVIIDVVLHMWEFQSSFKFLLKSQLLVKACIDLLIELLDVHENTAWFVSFPWVRVDPNIGGFLGELGKGSQWGSGTLS